MFWLRNKKNIYLGACLLCMVLDLISGDSLCGSRGGAGGPDPPIKSKK